MFDTETIQKIADKLMGTQDTPVDAMEELGLDTSNLKATETIQLLQALSDIGVEMCAECGIWGRDCVASEEGGAPLCDFCQWGEDEEEYEDYEA